MFLAANVSRTKNYDRKFYYKKGKCILFLNKSSYFYILIPNSHKICWKSWDFATNFATMDLLWQILLLWICRLLRKCGKSTCIILAYVQILVLTQLIVLFFHFNPTILGILYTPTLYYMMSFSRFICTIWLSKSKLLSY